MSRLEIVPPGRPEMTRPATRVVVASDIRLYREGLSAILARDGQLEAAGTAADPAQTLAALDETQPAVLLLDMGMPEATALIGEVTARFPEIKTVALGISETRKDVLECAEAGVQGYVCRESSLDELVDAVLGAVDGELRCPPAISAALMGGVARLAARMAASPPVRLTSRELEIAELIDAGMANREIAERLHIAVPTVKVHVHNILDKLEVNHRGAAAAKLRRFGLLRLPRAPGTTVSTPGH